MMNRTDKRNDNVYGYKILLSIIISLIFSGVAAQTPAFPGAEGHGRYVTGGRGGNIVHVTNLNDSGTGSFRQAVSGSSKKIVVFDVGGVIALKSDVKIGANTTIMGQTAPAPGITLRYYTVLPNGNNIIIRFLRFRRGQEKDVNDGADAIWTRNQTGIILDHCSMSWSIDEVASFYDNNNFTMQWCTIGESLNNAGHGKGAHGYGGIWGGKLASFHHNLILHVNNRSPRFNGARYNWTGYTGNMLYSEYQWKNAVQAENVDFRNCVIYNTDGCYGGPGGGQINMVGNYYKSGPAANISKLTQVTVGASGNASGYPIYWDMTSRYYLDDNLIDNIPAGWEKFTYDNGTILRNGDYYSQDPNHYNGDNVDYLTYNGTDYVRIRLDEPAPVGEVTTHNASIAYAKVLDYAGASLYRDDVDQRYANETMTGTCMYSGSVTGKPGRIDLVSDANGYTETNFGTGSREASFDTDRDGIPDDWELANGLKSNNATDASQTTIDPAKYYTNIEVYCNSLVQHIMVKENEESTVAVEDYYPSYYREDNTQVAAINLPSMNEQTDYNVTLSQSTNSGGNTSSTYYFNDDVTITNTKSKSYATGNNNGIKYSAGVQYTIRLPEKVSIDQITFIGYDNYTDVNAYLGEVNGVTYDATQYVFPKSKESVIHTVELSPAATGTITFTPQGKQVVLSIELKGKAGDSSFIPDIIYQQPTSPNDHIFNIAGQQVGSSYHGIVISHGKKRIQK